MNRALWAAGGALFATGAVWAFGPAGMVMALGLLLMFIAVAREEGSW